MAEGGSGGGWRAHHSGGGEANSGGLCELNNNSDFDLSDKVLAYYGTDVNSNPYLNINITSSFFDIVSFTAKYAHSPVPIYLSLNICSLNSKYFNLNIIITEFLKNKVPIEIIALQEIWQIPFPETVKIDGFNFIFKQRSNAKGGGVGFYLNENISYKILNGLTLFHEKTLESLTLEITRNKKKSIITNIYCSPTPPSNITQSENLANFTQILDELLHNISLFKLESLVFLDANINLLNLDRNQIALDYLDIVHSNSYIQTIVKATKIQPQSFTLIDHILTNSSNQNHETGTIVSDLSDHFFTFTTTISPSLKNKINVITKRNFSLSNLNNFKNYLGNFQWNDVVNCDNVNRAFDLFWDTFQAGFGLHFPETTIRFNKNMQN